MDPETMALIQAWLAGEIENPFGVSEADQNVWSGQFMPPEDEDEYGTLDWQNKRGTFGKKVNDIMSDPAYIAQLGTGPGGPGPEAFEPTVTWEPVKAPGYQNAMFMINSGDPISKYIAEEMMGVPGQAPGKTALQVVNELKQAVRNDPDLAMNLPTYESDMNPGQPQPDWKSVQGIADSLQKQIIDDPTFDDLDPQTGLPANRVETLSEIGQYFKDTNTPNPYETYSPDTLTTEGHLNAEAWHDRKAQNADKQLGAAQEQQAMAEAMLRELSGGRTMDEPLAGVSPNLGAYSDKGPDSGWGSVGNQGEGGQVGSGQAGDRGWGSVGGRVSAPAPHVPTIPGNWDGGNMGERSRNRQQLQDRTSLNRKKSAISQSRGKPSEAGFRAQRDLDRANMAALMANQSRGAAQEWTRSNERKRREREAMMRQLTAAGYTPYNNTMRGRQAGVFGN